MSIILFNRQGTERPHNFGPAEKPQFRTSRACWRCGGQGWAHKWEHTGKTCWRCGGNGIDPTDGFEKLYTAEKLEKLNASKAKADEKRADKKEAARVAEQQRRDTERAQVIADNAELISEIDAELKHGDVLILREFREQIMDRAKDLSDRQTDTLRAIVARNTAERARRAGARHIGVIGQRSDFVLTLVHTQTEEIGQFPTVYKHWSLFTDELGCKVESRTAPWTLGLSRDKDGGYTKGQVIRVKATVKNHRHDNKGEPITRIDRPKEIK